MFSIRRLHLYIAVSFLLLCATAQNVQAALPGRDYVPGEVLVRFRDGVAETRRNEIVKRTGAQSSSLSQINAVRLRLSATRTVEQTVSSLENDPDVLIAQPNYIYHTMAAPNDPYFVDGQQWNMTAIGMPAAWDIDKGETAIIIAVVDSGVDLDHPDLQSKLTPSSSWRDYIDSDSLPEDEFGHGTHVAGIAAAATDNSLGVAGVAWQCKIMPVRVLDDEGSGTTIGIAAGIDWAVNHGADVINLSLGASSSDSILLSAVTRAYNAGVVLVAAAGNKKDNEIDRPFYPAAYSQVIAVAATNSSNIVPTFSVRGDYVDVAAPGVSVISTYLSGTYSQLSG
ncbi:MAG: S8 family serine peptidase, partial [bacterium]|nr:S8 family serine peptidase [bacterium]